MSIQIWWPTHGGNPATASSIHRGLAAQASRGAQPSTRSRRPPQGTALPTLTGAATPAHHALRARQERQASPLPRHRAGLPAAVSGGGKVWREEGRGRRRARVGGRPSRPKGATRGRLGWAPSAYKAGRARCPGRTRPVRSVAFFLNSYAQKKGILNGLQKSRNKFSPTSKIKPHMRNIYWGLNAILRNAHFSYIQIK